MTGSPDDFSSPSPDYLPTEVHGIRLDDDKLFAVVGLWEKVQGPDGPVESCAILTTEENELVRPVHDRMPVILDRRHFEQWLDPAEQDAGRWPSCFGRSQAIGCAPTLSRRW